jgi:hypothetical protein
LVEYEKIGIIGGTGVAATNKLNELPYPPPTHAINNTRTDVQIGLIASDGCLKGKVYEEYFSRIFPEVK